MPSHNYAITVGGTALSSLGVESRFVKWTGGMKRGSNMTIPFKHGQLWIPDKYFDASDIMLEVFLPNDTTDAAAEALSEIQKKFSAQALVTVAQTDPHRGSIRAQVEVLSEFQQSQNQFVYILPLALPSGCWEDVSATSVGPANPPSITTGGDRPIDDMTITFAGPGFLEHTDSLSQVSRLTIDSGAGAGTYVVNVGTGSVTKSGVAQDRWLTATQAWWMKFSPAAAQSLTSNVNTTISWRNKWA